jgi:hypothetical protein
MALPIDLNEITKDKNIFDIYKDSKWIPDSSNNVKTTVTTFIAVLIYMLALGLPVEMIIDQIKNFNSIAINYFITTLGFLIAGFTIFVSISERDFFVFLASIPHSKYKGLTHLRYTFFVFINVFLTYIATTVIFMIFNTFLVDSMLKEYFLSIKYSTLYDFFQVVYNFVFSNLFTLFIYSIMSLLSFLFNIYSVLMTSTRWYIESKSNTNKDE